MITCFSLSLAWSVPYWATADGRTETTFSGIRLCRAQVATPVHPASSQVKARVAASSADAEIAAALVRAARDRRLTLPEPRGRDRGAGDRQRCPRRRAARAHGRETGFASEFGTGESEFPEAAERAG
ncbi:hypothetical protein Misp03_19490 [Microbispora sp. NBRC 16548]|nr:hypothetical protein Misp03_19490 [Microbispora sp. NBRC 16548]